MDDAPGIVGSLDEETEGITPTDSIPETDTPGIAAEEKAAGIAVAAKEAAPIAESEEGAARMEAAEEKAGIIGTVSPSAADEMEARMAAAEEKAGIIALRLVEEKAARMAAAEEGAARMAAAEESGARMASEELAAAIAAEEDEAADGVTRSRLEEMRRRRDRAEIAGRSIIEEITERTVLVLEDALGKRNDGKARKDGGVYASTFVPADAGMEPAAESGGSDEMAALRSEVTSLRSEVTALRSELRLMSDAIDLINAGITQSTVRTEGLDPTDDFTSEDLKANLEEEEDKSARLIQSTWRRNAVGQAESAEGVFVNDATSDDTEEFGADFEDVVLEDWMLKG